MTTPVAPNYKTYPTALDPAYNQRQSYQFGKITGNAATAKFVTLANSYLYSCLTLVDTLGTSTFSSTLSANTLQLTVVVNTSTTGTTVALTTATWGPYAIGGPVVSTSTGTAVIGGVNYIAFNTNTGAAALGGYYVPAGSEVIATLGTDATAVIVAGIDFQYAPLAPVAG
jgi:hypothetical protein